MENITSLANYIAPIAHAFPSETVAQQTSYTRATITSPQHNMLSPGAIYAFVVAAIA
jgi:hypothetical protein